MFNIDYFFKFFFFILFFFLFFFYIFLNNYSFFSTIIDEETVIFFSMSLVLFLLGKFFISSINVILIERISSIELEYKRSYESAFNALNLLKNTYLKILENNNYLNNYFLNIFALNLKLFSSLKGNLSIFFFKKSFLSFFSILKTIVLSYINLYSTISIKNFYFATLLLYCKNLLIFVNFNKKPRKIKNI
jgi:hypothetical protein